MLLFAVALVSFFAGSILMAHVQLGSCGALSHHGSAGDSHRLDAKVEELAQKRLLGEYCSFDLVSYVDLIPWSIHS